MRVSLWIFGLSVAFLLVAAAHAGQWTMTNPTGRTYVNEPVRLLMDIPANARQGELVVTADGKEVLYQVETIGPRKEVWVAANLGPDQQVTYAVRSGRPTTAIKKLVQVTQGEKYIEMSNGLTAVRVPVSCGAVDDIPAPIQAVQLPGGKWVGHGAWHTPSKLRAMKATVIGSGDVFGKVRLAYAFEGMAGLSDKLAAFAVIDVILHPGQRHVTIEETFAMSRGSSWTFDGAAGWDARRCTIRIMQRGPNGRAMDVDNLVKTLKAGQTRMGDTHVNLLPRWSQAYDDGWFFAAHDGTNAVGAVPVRAGDWMWPHENKIRVRVKDSGDYAGFQCPTRRGSRHWFLLVGPYATWIDADAGKRADGPLHGYVTRHAFQPLDKLHHDYILDWPGKSGKFSGEFFFSTRINPTGFWRGMGRNALRNAGKSGNIGTLTKVQVMFDPDMYGSYWNGWSPENPNFFTDFIKVPVGMTANLKGYPRFKELCQLAEQKLREDIYHSVTLPGGAGQECPGYLNHGLSGWKAMAPVAKEHLGFDITKWPRYRAAQDFLLHASQPISPGKRRCHPGGDTHPLGPTIEGSVRGFKTEELPGFGVIFRNNAGANEETYLAFKSGPNRGHFHGDQLSIHWCAHSSQIAIDHMCSYSPRAGQEHMHNRVAFHVDQMPWANMDGYERVIAFKTGNDCDIAVGQVESKRLRPTTKFPPEEWDVRLPQYKFDTPLKYRRTIVQMKNEGQDYFVIRDQHEGPDVKATYCLHVLGDKMKRSGQVIDFGKATLFCATPRQFEFATHDWSFSQRGHSESTKGVRLTVEGRTSEFITVLYPGRAPKTMEAIPGGVRVGNDEITFTGGIDVDDDVEITYVTVKRGGKVIQTLASRDINLNRSQGEVGLFVPDAGYPFGEIPDWLIKQRITKPSWYVPWDSIAKPKRQ